MIEVRRPLPDEWKQITEAYWASDPDENWSTEDTLEDAALVTYDDEDGYFVLAGFVDNAMVGWLWGTPSSSLVPELNPDGLEGPHAFIAAIYVRPDSRRRGVGSALMEAFAETARSSGAETVALRADMGDGLEARSAFFSVFGMVPVDENGFWRRLDG